MESNTRNIKNKIASSKKPWLIMITGVPACGKSTLAIQLAAKLNFKVCVGVDELKEVLKKYDQNPFIHYSSHDCWQLLGKRTKKNIIQGFEGYCLGLKQAVAPILDRSKRNGENLVIEGVHLLPELYKENGQFRQIHLILQSRLSNKLKSKIKYKIEERHGLQVDVWSEKMTEFIEIQKLIMKQGKNHRNCFALPEDTTENNLKRIINILEEECNSTI